jgi:RNA polymerase sigma factor (sigma-70 family)
MRDDAQLLAAFVQRRDAEAFASLIERYAAMVHGACRRICGDSPDADDAAQEVFIEFARQAARIRSSIPAWLHRVATRTAWRQRHRYPRGSPALAEPVSRPADADDDTSLQLQARVDAEISALPEDLRRVVVLRFLNGLDQQAIAHRLAVDQATVSRRIERAVTRLRARLQTTTPTLLGVIGGQVTIPPPILAQLRRIAITPPHLLPAISLPSLLPIGAFAVLMLMLAGFLLMHARAHTSPPSPTMSSRIAHADVLLPQPVTITAAVMDTRPSVEPVLERGITLTVRHLYIDEAVWNLVEHLQPALDESLGRLPGALRAECSHPIDIIADHEPLRKVLDGITRQSGWRWRERHGRILFDYPMIPSRLQELEETLTQAVAQLDVEATAACANAMAASLDADAYAQLLRMIADPHLDQTGSDRPAAVQAALLSSLASLPPDVMRTMHSNIPLALFAEDPRCRAGTAAAWRRSVEGRTPFTPFLCALPGMIGWNGAAPQLRNLVIAPDILARDLQSRGPIESFSLENLRRFSIWSLGQLQDHAALPLIIDSLHRVNGVDVIPSLDALGAMRDPAAATAVLSVDPGADIWVQAEQYAAIADCAPQRLDELLSHVPSGPHGWDLPLSEGILRCGLPQRPTLIGLRRLLSMTSSDHRGFAGSILPATLLELPRNEVLAELQPQVSDNDYQHGVKQYYRAFLGDGDAVTAQLAVMHHPMTDADWRSLELITLLAPTDGAARLAPWKTDLLEQMNQHALNLILNFLPDKLPSFLEKIPNNTEIDQGVLFRLETCNDPEAIDYLLNRIKADPDQFMAMMDSSVLPMNLQLVDSLFALMQATELKTRRLAMGILGSHFAELNADMAQRFLEILDKVPLDQLESDFPRRLAASQGSALLPQVVVVREVRLEIRWLAQAPSANVREAAAFWLTITMLADLRPIRQEIIRALLDRLTVETVSSVRDQLRRGLQLFMTPSNSPSWYEYGNEHLALGGLEDDHQSIRALDALCPRIMSALRASDAAAVPAKGTAARSGF